MDSFEKRLKRDADAIQADASEEFRGRLDASLRGLEPIRTRLHRESERRSRTTSLWWASSLTGLAAAIAIIMFLNWNRETDRSVPDERMTEETEPTLPDTPLVAPYLNVRTADFARPLEEELIKLQSDIEKASESVRKDLDFTF